MARGVSVGLVACAILAVCVLATAGVLTYTGSVRQFQPQITVAENFLSEIRGEISSGFSVISSGSGLASGNGLAEIEAGGGELMASTFTGNETVSAICGTTPRDSYIELVNTGTANGTATGVRIATGGANSDFTIAGPCTVGPVGSATAMLYVIFRGPNRLVSTLAPETGQQYIATVMLSTGAPTLYAGEFGQGFPQVTTSGVALLAAGFAQGKPGNVSCVTTPAPANMSVTLTNTGTERATVTSVTVTLKNVTSTFHVNGLCYVGPDGTASATVNVLFGPSNALAIAPETGQSFTGTVTLSNGMQIPFSGEFQ